MDRAETLKNDVDAVLNAVTERAVTAPDFGAIQRWIVSDDELILIESYRFKKSKSVACLKYHKQFYEGLDLFFRTRKARAVVMVHFPDDVTNGTIHAHGIYPVPRGYDGASMYAVATQRLESDGLLKPVRRIGERKAARIYVGQSGLQAFARGLGDEITAIRPAGVRADTLEKLHEMRLAIIKTAFAVLAKTTIIPRHGQTSH